MTTYSNPYIDTEPLPQFDKLPLADTDYDVLAALKYTELLHKQLIKQYQPQLQVAVCPDINTHVADSKRRARRVVQVCDNSTDALPDDMFDVLNYVDENVIEKKLVDEQIASFKFTYVPVKRVARPAPPAPVKPVRSPPLSSNNVDLQPPLQTQPPSQPSVQPCKRPKLEPAPAVNLVKAQPDTTNTITLSQSTPSASDWQFGAQRDQYGYVIKQRTLFGMSKPASKVVNTPAPVQSHAQPPSQPTPNSSIITLNIPHTISLKTPFAINEFPRNIKRQLYNYRVPRLRSDSQCGTHVLLWIDAARNIDDSYLPLQLALFMHSRLTLPVVAIVACDSADESVNAMAHALQARYSIPLLQLKSASYSQTCDAVRQWCSTVRPHAIVTEELFEDCRTLLKQNMVVQLDIQCSMHAIDVSHIIPIRYMPVNVGDSRVDLHALLLSRLKSMYVEVLDSDTEKPVLHMTVQDAVNGLASRLPEQLKQTCSILPVTPNNAPQAAKPLISPTVQSIRSLLQSGQYTVASLISQYVRSRCLTACSCVTSGTPTSLYILCDNTDCQCNACRVFRVLFNELVDYHLQDIQLHAAAQQQ